MVRQSLPAGPGNISVDAHELTDRLAELANPRNLRDLVEVLAESARATWRRAVSGEVLEGMTKAVYSDNYAAAIDDPSHSRFIGNDILEIDLSDLSEAVRIERGYPAYDLKPGLLRRVKGGKGGGYVDVPFRHGTPPTRRDGPDPRAGSGFATTMSPLMYRLARQMEPSPGGDYIDDPSTPLTKPQIGGMGGPSTHKAALYQGMRRYRGQDGPGTNGSRYLTFRRVSENSSADAWWHPGEPANPVAASVAKAVQKQVPGIVAAYVRALLSG